MEIPLHILEPRDLDWNILRRNASYFDGRIIKHLGAQGHVLNKAIAGVSRISKEKFIDSRGGLSLLLHHKLTQKKNIRG